MAPEVPSPQKQNERTLCGVIHEAAEAAQEKRENRTKPQPWIVRKLMVGFTTGIMGYTAYVYIRQLCLPMIWRQEGAPASRGVGIALLAVFCVLYLWMIWAYLMVVTTSPGYARDYIPKSERPLIPALAPFRDSFQSAELSHHPNIIPSPQPPGHDLEMGRPDSFQRNRSFSAATSRSQARSQTSALPRRENGLAGPSYEDLLRRDASAQLDQESNAGIMDSISVPKPAFMNKQISPPIFPVPTSSAMHLQHDVGTNPLNPKIKANKLKSKSSSPTQSVKRAKELEESQRLELMGITRKPPTSAVLQPVHRYCTVDGLVKPYRTHHCRVCGTCVLKYDHHCPWIGQCVGARNHKFFLNFCQATTVFTAYTLGTLIAYTVAASNMSVSSDINAQEIVIIGLAGIFFLFTILLAISHTNLILNGQTTVESMQIRHMKEREDRTLAKGFSWWQFGAKQRLTRKWDQEWGRLNKEGNIWWRGNSRDEWMDVMGGSRLGWILPTVRRNGSNGLDYPVNPRFDFEGRWRKRSEWPEALR